MKRLIRRLDLAQLGTLLDWAALEGWNPGLTDATAFHAADPTGFFGCFVGDILVAGMAAIAYDEHFGFIGLYICHPDWRGQGHGKAVWDAGMTYLGGRTIGLDGVPEQQANYARMGFIAGYQTIRMTGTLPVLAEADTGTSALSPEEIRDLDRHCFPARRDGFLRHWLTPPNRVTAHRAEGGVVGYAVVRPCLEGNKIGPLFAANLDTALAILESLSGPVQLDVPADQTAWLAALSERGFTPGFMTTRMYRGTPPSVDLHRVFGVTSLELG